MNAQQKLDALAEEKTGHEQSLKNLQTELDKAADTGDLAKVKNIQLEISATGEMIASCIRREKTFQADLIREQKDEQRRINDALVAEIKGVFKLLPPRAAKIGKVIDTLRAELESFHAEAHRASEPAYQLVKQMDDRQSSSYDALPGCAGFKDDTLGYCLINELFDAGVFARLAPVSPSVVRLPRIGMPPIKEVIEDRVSNLITRIETAHSRIDESLK